VLRRLRSNPPPIGKPARNSATWRDMRTVRSVCGVRDTNPC